jgi:hypothetical protein
MKKLCGKTSKTKKAVDVCEGKIQLVGFGTFEVRDWAA